MKFMNWMEVVTNVTQVQGVLGPLSKMTHTVSPHYYPKYEI